MLAQRTWLVPGLLLTLSAATAVAQAPATSPQDEAPRSERRDDRWRNSGSEAPRASDRRADARGSNEPLEPLRPIDSPPRRTAARVTKGTGELPNEHGQLWREYDISPYTLRVTATSRPEQAIVDWILRETGYEAWHSEPVALLSANQRTLRVYHTPEMHAVVAELVDRFISTEAETHAFGVRVITVDNPNWRAKAQPIMRSVPVQTPGTQAWLLAKEDAGLLVAELRKRTDFREHSSPHLLVNNGQSAVVSSRRPRPYLRDILLRPDSWPGYESEIAQIDEGFSLELSPLLSLDGSSVDAVLKCNIDQVEKIVPVILEVPSVVGNRQRAKIEVPQITQSRLHEQFRWPTDQVLLISLGIVASPVPGDQGTQILPIPLTGPPRADLLVFIESKGKTGQAPTVSRTGAREGRSSYRDRY